MKTILFKKRSLTFVVTLFKKTIKVPVALYWQGF
jgi:hypothetical protein